MARIASRQSSITISQPSCCIGLPDNAHQSFLMQEEAKQVDLFDCGVSCLRISKGSTSASSRREASSLQKRAASLVIFASARAKRRSSRGGGMRCLPTSQGAEGCGGAEYLAG